MEHPCPGCGTPLAAPPVGAAPITVCQTCGHRMDTGYLREALTLGEWHTMAGRRLDWLHDRLAAQDLAEAASPVDEPATEPRAGRAGPGGAGSLLLATGAFFLVAAGIAFIAFTWDLLGPLGQVLVLLAIGSACLAAAAWLTHRLHGTSIALGIVGTLLVVISAVGARVLGPDVIGATSSLVFSLAIAALLTAAAIRIRRVNVAVGEVGALTGAALVVVELATAPGDDAVPLDTPWQWWAALVLGTGAVALVSLSDRFRIVSWPWLGAFFTVFAAGALADQAAVVADPRTPSLDQVVRSSVLLAVASVVAAVVVFTRRHRVAVLCAGAVIWLFALALAIPAAAVSPPARPWIALDLAWAALLPFALGVAATRRADEGQSQPPPALVWYLAAGVLALGVGVLVAPWGDLRAATTYAEWASEGWPWWRGLLAGLAISGFFVGVGESDLRWRPQVPVAHRRIAPVSGLVALVAFILCSAGDQFIADQELVGAYRVLDDAVKGSVNLAVALFAVTLLGYALVRRVDPRAVWASSVFLALAGLNQLYQTRLTEPWQPEAFGIALGLPVLIGAVAWWWLRRPPPPPTWQTLAPPFVAFLAPSTFALLDQTMNQWTYDVDPTPGYQSRMVGLLLIGAVAAVIGARQRWAGLFFPGLALALVVVGIQLLELGRFLPQWVSFAAAGALLVAAGARWEAVRGLGRRSAAWTRTLR